MSREMHVYGLRDHEIGIKENSKKIESLLQLRSPQTVKEVHTLNDKLVALGPLLEKST